MGWVTDQYERNERGKAQGADSLAENCFESREHAKWSELLRGLQHDVDEFRRLTGSADIKQISDTECRISNSELGLTLILLADRSAHLIRYDYDSQAPTAAPVGGVLSLRAGDGTAELFSADQRLTSEQARRLVLEPLLFPPPRESLQTRP